MNKEILKRHISRFVADGRRDLAKLDDDLRVRAQISASYQQFSRDKILAMTPEEIYSYVSKLWAMLIWGNKHYVVDKLIEDNKQDDVLRRSLADLVWGESSIAQRWDSFRAKIKGMGPAMISEILCKTHPNDFMLWNRRAYVGLNYLQVQGLPRYDYQLTGDVYCHLCLVAKEIARELGGAGFPDTTLLAVDYFIREELQVEENLSKISVKNPGASGEDLERGPEESKFIHNDVRDKLRDIGEWLGFAAKIEQKICAGAKVDAVWEATIGNMGRVIYVFEVQTKGSIDSLILNLLKSLNNPAVQGVIAVSDSEQLMSIKGQAQNVKELRDKLKYWDYENVLKVHEGLEFVYGSINGLGLVPEGF